jgi:hypothetical protein
MLKLTHKPDSISGKKKSIFIFNYLKALALDFRKTVYSKREEA